MNWALMFPAFVDGSVTRLRVCAALLLACVATSGCVDPNDPAKFKAPTDDGPKAPDPDAIEAQSQALSAEVMPLPEDFEDEVARAITRDNYGQALEALEAEVAQ